MFYFGQIISGIEIFWDKKCKVTFGFKYISEFIGLIVKF